jgi:hypothetical protein
VKSELSTMFNKYDLKFGAVRHQVPPPTTVTGKRKQNWGLIYASDCVGVSKPGGSLDRRVNCRRVPQPRWVNARRNTKEGKGAAGGRQA